MLALEDYLPNFWPSLTDVQTLFESVRDSLQSSKEPLDTGNISHWSAEKIREELKKVSIFVCLGRVQVCWKSASCKLQSLSKQTVLLLNHC